MPVTVVYRYGRRIGWACGVYRAERTPVTLRRCRWRVWAVIGGATVATGIEAGAREADRRALEVLEAVAEQTGATDGG